ncbi:MAG: ABC transporter permease subunit [Streptosporangiales bacterium]|nr:ABC transporter permease subunit [Streptosporangiales bacterium]
MSALAEPLRSPGADRRRLRRRFTRRPPAVVGLLGVAVVVLVAVLAPWVAPHDPSASDYALILVPPGSPGHLLGTDDVGRDLLSRLVVGSRASLTAGVLSTLLAMLVAVPIGLLAGYYRGWLDPVISRVTDVVLAFPFLILAVGLAAILGPSLINATIALAVSQVPGFVRVTRGEVLGLREQEYVEAAVVNGAPDRVVLVRHILPNTVNPLIVQATVAIPTAIIGAAVLSFLGLGEQPPTPSWGTMLSDAQQYITQAPWFAIFPGLAIALTTLSFNLFGDGLRDVLDVRTRT